MVRKILIVDDDREDCEMIGEAMSECRKDIIFQFVANGEDLISRLDNDRLDIFRDRQTDLIFLDLNMPRKDGREVLKEIKQDPLLRKIPVVVLTTSNSDEDIENAYSLGADSYVVKPICFLDLVSTLGSVMNYWFDIVHSENRHPDFYNSKMGARRQQGPLHP